MQIRRFRIIVAALVSIFMVNLLISCERETHNSTVLDRAEILVEHAPDSALRLLDSVSQDSFKGAKERARYALLMSMALDKNYIDTTTFDVLQPALDYYLKKGTPDEKLLTYLYQGRIFLNADDKDNAMMAFLRGREVNGISDSLTFARLLMDQGSLYDIQYKYPQYIDNNIKAARLFQKYDRPQSEVSCYAHALEGSIILFNKQKADSLYQICRRLVAHKPDYEEMIAPTLLAYLNEYGEENEIKAQINKHSEGEYPLEMKRTLANAYIRLGDGHRALKVLDSLDSNAAIADSISYYLIRSSAQETAGDYKAAILSYKLFTERLLDYHETLFNHDLIFAERKYQAEIDNLNAINQRDRMIGLAIAIIVIITLLVGVLILRNRMITIRKQLLAEENRRLALEKMTLEYENEYLEDARQNAELQSEIKEREIEDLIDEKDTLKKLLDKERALTAPLRNMIKGRVKCLDEILIHALAADQTDDQLNEQWIESIQESRKQFIASTKNELEIFYPQFIQFVKSKQLSDLELNYVCLIAIGLRGKDLQPFFNSKSHYNIAATVRKKLGIDNQILAQFIHDYISM